MAKKTVRRKTKKPVAKKAPAAKRKTVSKRKTRKKTTTKRTTTKRAKTPARKKAAKKTVKKKRKPNAAFMKPLTPSADLAAIVGKGSMPRTEVTKKLWAYIKRNKLQDEVNKRMIKPDAKLAKVFGSSKAINMFQMTKHVAKHLK